MAAKKLTDRFCRTCGEKYKPPRASSKYCSEECYRDQLTSRQPATPVREDTVEGNKRTISAEHQGAEPKNTEELMQFLNVDPAEWQCDKWWAQSRVVVQKNTPDRVIVTLRAVFSRNIEIIHNTALLDAMFAKAGKKALRPIKIAKPSREGVMLEFGPYDSHFGLQAWGKETGGDNYDLDIATEQWSVALDKILSRTAHWPIAEVNLVIGNDMVHYDNRNQTTTAGTPQDADTRYHRLMDHLTVMLRDQAARIAAHVAPVKIVVAPGNHDAMSAVHLGRALECYFDKSKHVTVDNEPSHRKYIRFGRCLIMATHGDAKGGENALRKLPNVMARERPQDWAETTHREVHVGHLHTESVRDIHGVIIRRILAMTPACAWSSREGFGHPVRGVEGFLWHRDEGLVDQPRVVIA